MEQIMMADQRVVLVTGASSGIGETCARFLSQRGHRVYGVSRRAAGASNAGDNGVIHLSMDITRDVSVKQAVGFLLQREGRIDIVVNSAGIGIAGAIEETSIEEARTQLEVNFFGVLRICRAVLPAMRERGSGYIVNIGSIGGLIAIPYQGLYSASKFALEGLSESLRMEVKDFGIRVVIVEPGDHKTSFTENRRPTDESSGNSPYRDRFHRAVARMAADEQSNPGPERVARLVYKIVTTANPRFRYTVGPASQRAAVLLKRIAPYSLVEKVMRGHYGV
ncbi:MAG TPA: SDR family NAD(P)-dependent oxidoreductase [Bryobacteraceae bacterium]|nr:SDR family NAD(P)-dependent oxidoreductase [Bryobacteraceae bacterium]